MSLIVLSNKNFNESDRNVEVGGIKKAYSFTNTLQTPIVLPKDSEVALQSVKLNKDGLFSLNRSNSLMYQYIGKKLSDTFQAEQSPRHPALIRVNPYGEHSADSFVSDALIPSMNTGLYHPNYQGLANASVQRSASGLVFEGFNLTYDKSATASGNNRPGDDDVTFATVDSSGWEYTATNHRFTKTSGAGDLYPRAFAQFTNAPMDLADGELAVDFDNATTWRIGLSRYCNPEAEYDAGGGVTQIRDFTQPEYFEDNELGFYDYVAIAEYDETSTSTFLKVFHAVKIDADSKLKMKEVVYYGFTGATYATPYDLGVNASAFNRIHFETSGEAVKISLSKSGATKTVVTYPTLGTPTGKDNYCKPINQCCSYLYPKMEITDTTTAGDAQNEYLQFHEYKCKVLTGFNYDGIDETKSADLPLQERLINYDWWATMLNIGRISYCLDVDMRVFNDMTKTETHDFVETSGGKIAYDVVPIVSESAEYTPTKFANMSTVLGFTENALRTPDSVNGSAVTFTSDVIPTLQSNESIFIRLSSLTQRSVNGVTGNESKIIYHCPRFDTAGNQTGGLFFEPGEKTYLDVGNISETPINSFTIDVINSSEKVVKSIVGATVVVLHIREKKKQ